MSYLPANQIMSPLSCLYKVLLDTCCVYSKQLMVGFSTSHPTSATYEYL